MNHEHPTIEEQEAAKLFASAKLAEPRRELLQSILADHSVAVTKSTTIRILNQENTKGRAFIIHAFLNIMNSAWKKILPFGALAAVLIIAVMISTKQPASGPLTPNEINQTVDELMSDLAAEEALMREEDETIFNYELYNQFEVIYEPYEI